MDQEAEFWLTHFSNTLYISDDLKWTGRINFYTRLYFVSLRQKKDNVCIYFALHQIMFTLYVCAHLFFFCLLSVMCSPLYVFRFAHIKELKDRKEELRVTTTIDRVADINIITPSPTVIIKKVSCDEKQP